VRSQTKRTWPASYSGAALCTAISLGIRWLLNPLLGSRNPYTILFLAVLVSARYCGLGPSILCAVGGGMAATYLFASDVGVLVPLFFLLTSGAAMWVIELQRRERRVAEENARTAARLRAIVESSGDAIISKNLDGVVESWNRAAETIFGYSSQEMLGKNISVLLPEDRVTEELDIVERIRHGRRVKHFETVRLRKDGTGIPVSLTISPVHDAAGVVVGASHIARDITEQKNMEAQLRQTQKLESLGVLAGGLAHDFNNLLTGIIGNASLAVEAIERPEAVRAHSQEILRASERAALLVRQMLAYAGKARYIVEPTDLSQQVTDIVELLRTSIPRSVDLKLQLERGLPPIDADRSQLQQLIMNLAINAAEATGEQPGTVTIATSRRELDSETQVVLTVKDTGCGMDEATRAHMFDPFFTTKFTGRGLGLAAVLGIIRTHRGTIAVDTAPGAGTTIAVVLPASGAQPGAPAAEPETDLRGYGNILVVDDEDLVRKLAKFSLERLGYTTEVAANGKEALEMFTAHPAEFAAVLLDLTMPVMGGEELLGHLHEIRPEIPVVLSSGFNEAEAMRRFEDRHLAGFLQKPYTANALARKIKQALRR
jgi:PAS domain S-box-containing protein